MSIENVGKEGDENRKNEARMQKRSPLVAPNRVGGGPGAGKSSPIFLPDKVGAYCIRPQMFLSEVVMYTRIKYIWPIRRRRGAYAIRPYLSGYAPPILPFRYVGPPSSSSVCLSGCFPKSRPPSSCAYIYRYRRAGTRACRCRWEIRRLGKTRCLGRY